MGDLPLPPASVMPPFPPLSKELQDLCSSILRTFFERKGLSKKATNWLSGSVQLYFSRLLAYDNWQCHSEAEACGPSTAAAVPGRGVCHDPGLAWPRHLAPPAPLLGLLRAHAGAPVPGVLCVAGLSAARQHCGARSARGPELGAGRRVYSAAGQPDGRSWALLQRRR